jgi:hypothetical protein
VIPEQRHPALFDRWQALVTPATDDEDRYLSYLVRSGAGSVSACSGARPEPKPRIMPSVMALAYP